MEETKETDAPFRILSARNNARFHSTEFLVALKLPYVLVDPIHDLVDVIAVQTLL